MGREILSLNKKRLSSRVLPKAFQGRLNLKGQSSFLVSPSDFSLENPRILGMMAPLILYQAGVAQG